MMIREETYEKMIKVIQFFLQCISSSSHITEDYFLLIKQLESLF